MFDAFISIAFPFSSSTNDDGSDKTVTLFHARVVGWGMFAGGYVLRPTIQRTLESINI